MDLQLDGKIAAVTGGSIGIGRAIAESLASEGCKVAICARDKGGSTTPRPRSSSAPARKPCRSPPI